jgi:hypothetical protein
MPLTRRGVLKGGRYPTGATGSLWPPLPLWWGRSVLGSSFPYKREIPLYPEDGVSNIKEHL